MGAICKKANFVSLTKKAVSAVSWTLPATLVKGVVQISQIFIVARALDERQLGIYSIVLMIIGFAMIINESGITNAFIYFKNMTKKQQQALMSLSINFSLLLALIIFLCSGLIADFFSVPEIAFLLQIVAPIFVLKSLAQFSIARLQKHLKFNVIAKFEVASTLLSFIVLIVGLQLGFEIVALIISQYVLVITCLLLLMINNLLCFPRHYSFIPSGIRPSIRYGLYQSGESSMNYIGANLDQLLIAKLLSTEILGVYAYIKSLVMKPALNVINPVVNRITFPLMNQYKGKKNVGEMYLLLLRVLSAILLPFYSVLFFYPEQALSLAFGQAWEKHAMILKLLSAYMMLISLMNPIGNLIRTTGAVKRGMYWNLVISILRPILIVVTLPYGLNHMLIALLAFQCILFILHRFLLIAPVTKFNDKVFVISILKLVLSIVITVFIADKLFSSLFPAWIVFVSLGFIYVFVFCLLHVNEAVQLWKKYVRVYS